MTKSRKRRESEQKKAAALIAAPTKPQGCWLVLEVKKIAYRPDERKAGKPRYVRLPAESGKTIFKRLPGASQARTIITPMTFPCARMILQHSVGGTLVKLGYSQRTYSRLDEGGKRELVSGESFTVTKVEEYEDDAGRTYYEPVEQAESMGRTLFTKYTQERFGIECIPETLQYTSLIED
jgi:hypothetical protein